MVRVGDALPKTLLADLAIGPSQRFLMCGAIGVTLIRWHNQTFPRAHMHEGRRAGYDGDLKWSLWTTCELFLCERTVITAIFMICLVLRVDDEIKKDGTTVGQQSE